jgi:hypothetical protein
MRQRDRIAPHTAANLNHMPRLSQSAIRLQMRDMFIRHLAKPIQPPGPPRQMARDLKPVMLHRCR